MPAKSTSSCGSLEALVGRRNPRCEGRLFAVKYTDIEALANILEANAVHTVISTIQVNSPEAGVSEINLVKAASRSGRTKRFISSNWPNLVLGA